MTKPFRFPLERVLDYRDQLEEQAKAALARAQAAYSRQVEAVEGLKAALAEHMAAMSRETAQDAGTLWLMRTYKERLLLDIRDSEIRLRKLADDVNRARTDLIRRAKERKLLEILKEKQAKRHARAETLAEQKEYDEIATLRFGRFQAD